MAEGDFVHELWHMLLLQKNTIARNTQRIIDLEEELNRLEQNVLDNIVPLTHHANRTHLALVATDNKIESLENKIDKGHTQGRMKVSRVHTKLEELPLDVHNLIRDSMQQSKRRPSRKRRSSNGPQKHS